MFLKPCYLTGSNYILDRDFSEYYTTRDVDELWMILKSTLLEAIDLFVPQARITHNSQSKWFTPVVRHKIDKLHYHRRKHNTTPTTERIQTLTSELHSEILEARAAWEQKLIHGKATGNSHLILAHIRSISKHSTFPNPMTSGSSEATTPQDKAELFNKYFHSVLVTSSTPSQLKEPSHSPLHRSPF